MVLRVTPLPGYPAAVLFCRNTRYCVALVQKTESVDFGVRFVYNKDVKMDDYGR